VIDIRAPPLFSMAPSLPEVIKDWDDFIDKTGIDEHFQMNRMILSADPITQKFGSILLFLLLLLLSRVLTFSLYCPLFLGVL